MSKIQEGTIGPDIKKMENVPQVIKDDEIDFVAILKTLWGGRKIIVKSVIIMTLLGFCVAIFSPKQYVASGIFIPKVSDGKTSSSSLSGLAAMAGISLGNSLPSAEISPTIYPKVIEGTSFCKELMESKIKVSDVEYEVSFFQYFNEIKSPSIIGYIKKYTLGLPGLLKKAFQGEKEEVDNSELEVETLTEEEYIIKKLIPEILTLDVDDQVGYVSISAKMPEALAAAQVANTSLGLLQKYVTNYKISSAKKDLQFIEERFTDKEKELYWAQEQLAHFTDQNNNIASAYAKTQYERLSADYQLKLSIYNELAKQLEQAKIKVTEDTPTFNTIQKVTVPNEKAEPKRAIILVVFVFFGCCLGISIVYGKILFAEMKKKW